jgi:sugar lactone lactonase YvrE
MSFLRRRRRAPSATPLAVDVVCALGEGPTWDADRRVAHLVDIVGGTLWELSLGPRPVATEVLRVDGELGAAVHAEGGGFLLAAGGGLRHVGSDLATRHQVDLVPASVRSRLNDGATDPAGRFLVGSLALDGRRGGERLWRLEHDGTVTVLDDDLDLSNGLGWSPDGGTLYSVDSTPGTVWARTYDVDTGRTGNRRRLLTVEDGTPDGLTVDAEGNLWIAIWGRGEVRGFSASGAPLEAIAVDAPPTTSCAFVGADLDTLLITTAAMAEPGVDQTRDGGRLFSLDRGVRGRPTTAWRPVA